MPDCEEDCEGCDLCSTASPPVYQEKGKWWATYYGCSLEPIGPFDTQGEAQEAQAIQDSPTDWEYINARSEAQQDKDYAHLLSLGGKSWNGGCRSYQGKHYGFAIIGRSYRLILLEQVG